MPLDFELIEFHDSTLDGISIENENTLCLSWKQLFVFFVKDKNSKLYELMGYKARLSFVDAKELKVSCPLGGELKISELELTGVDARSVRPNAQKLSIARAEMIFTNGGRISVEASGCLINLLEPTGFCEEWEGALE